jgi:putative inorganic carbon (HCO3(-)) transporter
MYLHVHVNYTKMGAIMSSQDISVSLPERVSDEQEANTQASPDSPSSPPSGGRKVLTRFSPFWKDRLFEGGLILSMVLYYLIHSPLLSLPFLLIFAVLSWYRLPFAIALLPLTLPYYSEQYQKVVIGSSGFSLAEITLAVCLLIAVLRFLFRRDGQGFKATWVRLRQRMGPFSFPILAFLMAALLSLFVAYNLSYALRDFRKEILDPLLYFGLVLIYLRSRQDLLRLVGALLAAGIIIALFGLVQYFFLKNTLILEEGARRVHAVYGSANSIGLFFDYALPLGLAWIMGRVGWRSRLLALLLCIPMLVVLYLTHSLGAWLAIGVALLLILACSIRNRKVLLIGGLIALAIGLIVLALYFPQIVNYVAGRHADQSGVGTAAKRIYLWQSALNMIHDSPWLGYGLDNWLCHYSKNTICDNSLYHYWILTDPSGHPTGLRNEPNLSHPHNIFLQIWVSMGILGLLAFWAVLSLFSWLYVRVLRSLRSPSVQQSEQLRWITIGVGAAVLAALVQGMIDSSFLEQDLAFCFWTLIAMLLLLRELSHTPWRGRS